MRSRKIISAIIGFLILSAVFVPYLAASLPQAEPPAQADNLLLNPGFEGRFHSWNSINEIQVAANWTPWWWEDNNHNPPYFRPEFKRANAAFYPNRVLSGESAQQYFTFHASHVAGMYQQVFNVRPGQLYRFTIWAQVWSSLEDNPNSSVLPANPHLQVGIDPTGFWNAGSPDVIWSAEAPMSSVIDQWGQVSVEARARGDIITVFMRTRPEFGNKHNDMYWDQANLVAISASAATPYPPTNTATPLDESAQVTNTLAAEIAPTNPSTPAEVTISVNASETPSPIPSLSATNTPPASKTSRPSRTPKPSRTPTMTATTEETKTAPASPTVTSTAKPTRAIAVVQNSPAPTMAASETITNSSGEVQPQEEDKENSGRINSIYIFLIVVGLLIVVGYLLISRIWRGNQDS